MDYGNGGIRLYYVNGLIVTVFHLGMLHIMGQEILQLLALRPKYAAMDTQEFMTHVALPYRKIYSSPKFKLRKHDRLSTAVAICAFAFFADFYLFTGMFTQLELTKTREETIFLVLLLVFYTFAFIFFLLTSLSLDFTLGQKSV